MSAALTPAEYEAARDIFLAARELPPLKRADYVDHACGSRPAIIELVRVLLENDTAAQTFLDQPALGPDFDLPDSVTRLLDEESAGRGRELSAGSGRLPERIGDYRVLGLLGRGGMGIVYRAEQDRPRRTVALKVMQVNLLTEEAARRFDHETQVLGLLQHPGIAQIHEAGTANTPDGPRPFFAMELVEGRPLTEFASAHRLTLRQRIELVISVCSAVQHAHQKGVIHRDLKPANILVAENGAGSGTLHQPKILDFGVARATNADIQNATLQTTAGQIIGTLLYMSPEQASGDPSTVDTRTDVYALGAIAYELFTGSLPFNLAGKPVYEAARILREESVRTPSELNEQLKGDLDTILLKALEKEKDQRYASAGDLAADLQRFLHDEPIAARPPSSIYQLKKFARRNRTLVGSLAVVFLALVVGLVAVAYGLVQAQERRRVVELERNRAVAAEQHAIEEADRAKTEAAKAGEILRFMEEMLASADPEISAARDVTVAEVVEAAAADVERKFGGRPEVEASVRLTIGNTYRSVGRYDEAEEQLNKALAILETLGDAASLYESRVRISLATLQLNRGEYTEAEENSRRSLNLLGAHPDMEEDLVLAQSTLSKVLTRTGAWDEAGEILNECLERKRRLFGDRHEMVAATLHDMAILARYRDDYETASAHAEEALSIAEESFEPTNPQLAHYVSLVGGLRQDAGDYAGSLPYFERALEIRLAAYGPEHHAIAAAYNNLASINLRLGDLARARELLENALDTHVRVMPKENRDRAMIQQNLAAVHARLGDYAAAQRLFEEAIATLRTAMGADHPDVAAALNGFGGLMRRMHREEEARKAYEESLRIRREVYGEEHPLTANTLTNLGRLLRVMGELEDAERTCRQALDIRRKSLPENHPDIAHAVSTLGEVLLDSGKLDEAEGAAREALNIRIAALGEAHPRTIASHVQLGEVFKAQGRLPEAEKVFSDAWDALHAPGQERSGPADQGDKIAELLAEICDGQDRAEEAAAWRSKIVGKE